MGSRRCCGRGCSASPRSRPGWASSSHSWPACRAFLFPRLHAMAADRRALLTAQGFCLDRGRVQRRQSLTLPSCGAAGPAPRPPCPGERRAADGGRDRGGGSGLRAHRRERQPVAGRPWLGGSATRGLALLIIPLVNVVLAAVPVEVSAGASGLFSTAQQLGGALGVALFGTAFFCRLSAATRSRRRWSTPRRT